MTELLIISLSTNILITFLFFLHRRKNRQIRLQQRKRNHLVQRLQEENDYFAGQHRDMQEMIQDLSAVIEQIGRDCQSGKSGIINLHPEHKGRKKAGQFLVRIGRTLKDSFTATPPPVDWYGNILISNCKNRDLPKLAQETFRQLPKKSKKENEKKQHAVDD